MRCDGARRPCRDAEANPVGLWLAGLEKAAHPEIEPLFTAALSGRSRTTLIKGIAPSLPVQPIVSLTLTSKHHTRPTILSPQENHWIPLDHTVRALDHTVRDDPFATSRWRIAKSRKKNQDLKETWKCLKGVDLNAT